MIVTLFVGVVGGLLIQVGLVMCTVVLVALTRRLLKTHPALLAVLALSALLFGSAMLGASLQLVLHPGEMIGG